MIKTSVKISGMSCSMCEAHINDTIRKVFSDAKKVSSSHKKGEASFLTQQEIDETDIEKLRKAIDDTGYSFISAESKPYEKKFWFK